MFWQEKKRVKKGEQARDEIVVNLAIHTFLLQHA